MLEGPGPAKRIRPRWWAAGGKGVGAGIVLLLALLWLAGGQNISLFSAKTQRVYVVFKSVAGLKKGERVQVAGLPKGKVTDLGIIDVVVEAEGHVKLDPKVLDWLLASIDLEEPGAKATSILSMKLATEPKDEAKQKDWVWAIKGQYQRGPMPEDSNGTLRLNADNAQKRLPELREALIAQPKTIDFTRAVNIASRDMSGDYDTLYYEFTRDEETAKPDEFTFHVRKPEQMVLCTLELEEDVPVGWDEDEPAKRPPYRITVQQTAPLIGTPFVAMERSAVGSPLLLPKTDEQKHVVRMRPLNLGVQEATGLDEIALQAKKFLPRLDEMSQNLGKTVEELSKVMEKLNAGQGTLAMLVNDSKFRDEFHESVTHFRDVMRKVDSNEGSVGKMFANAELYDQLASATKRLDEVLKKINEGGGTASKLLNDSKIYDDSVAAVDEAKDILNKVNKGEGLASRMLNDKKFGDDASDALANISSVSGKFDRGEGLFGELVSNQQLKEDFKVFVHDSKEMMGSAKGTFEKLNKGESALGKLMVDPKLGKKVEEAIGGAAETFGAIARTRTFIGVTSKYWGTSKEWVNKGYIRVAPRENMFIQLGGAAISTVSGSPVDDDPDGSGETLFKIDAQLGYKFFDNHLTLRAGLIEGEPGGGVDYQFTVPGWEHDFMASVEARGGHDEKDGGINEHESVIVHGELSTEIWKYLRVYVGAGNSTDGMDFMGGITFEWNDNDLKAFVGLLGSAKN